MAPYKSTKSDEQKRRDTIVMVTAILFVGALMGGVLGYKINAAENIDPAELEAMQQAAEKGEPIKSEPNPWSM